MRLIDAEELYKKKYASLKEGEVLYRFSTRDIDTAETVDAVPVVRCRECKHWQDWGSCGHPDNGFDAPPMGPDDFCSKGKRQTD